MVVAVTTTLVFDPDIWRAVTLLIRQYGPDAEVVAARRADELMEREDYEGCALWLRIKRAVAELQSQPSGRAH